MKIVIRVKHPETKRYRTEYEAAKFLFTDSQHLPNVIHRVPLLLDSVICDGFSTIYVNFSHPPEPTPEGSRR